MTRKTYRPRDNYPHGFAHNSYEYGRMKYLSRVLNISYEEYCTNREKYDSYKNTRKKHLHLDLYSPEYYKTIWLKKKYDITIEQYNEMLEAQGGVCLICGKPETTRHRKSGLVNDLSVDHCHITGKVRGLLCNACNKGMGAFGDNPDLMQRAIEHIKKFQ